MRQACATQLIKLDKPRDTTYKNQILKTQERTIQVENTIFT